TVAAGNAIKYLQDETSCAVCLDFFQDPLMILSCGHNFCRRCLSWCAAGGALCQQCQVPFPARYRCLGFAMKVCPSPDWALGVAWEFVSHKGCFGLSPKHGVWAVGQWLGQLQALTWPSPTSLPHNHTVRRIEVAVDYPGGWVTFRDADSQTEVFAFPPPTFTLWQLLCLGKGPALLTLCP
ncbi:butyrophilin subfamily 1 member A1-like, partial [Anomalospiza imberbis]|uniref:butyrophilin subfamily 1 member A1-like n=1 Tax=Anomalospiza imberbis TaxID=187417 RepID=UPI00358E2DE7